ncbi:hypothetical protein RFI_28399, partial [Reticulomyxa filosa]
MLTFVLLRDWINKGKLSILFYFIVHQIVQCFFIGYFNFVYDKEFSPKLLFLQQTLFASKEVKIIRNLSRILFAYIIKDHLKEKKEDFSLVMKSKEEEIQIIIHHWTRTLNIQLGWIKDFDKFVVNYVSSFFFLFKYQPKTSILFNIGKYYLH